MNSDIGKFCKKLSSPFNFLVDWLEFCDHFPWRCTCILSVCQYSCFAHMHSSYQAELYGYGDSTNCLEH